MSRLAVVLGLATILAATACRRAEPEPLVTPEPGPSESKVDPRVQGVCTHSFALLVAENPALDSDAVERDFVSGCVTGNLARREQIGSAAWNQRASCIERAQTSAELRGCDGERPQPEPASRVAEPSLEPREVCRYVVDMVEAEVASQGGSSLFTPEDRANLIEECARMAGEERDRDPGKYRREAECIVNTTTMAELNRCDEDSQP